MDQPYYKAENVVRFRVLTVEFVDDKLQPLFIPFTVQILDTQRNVVKEFINANNSEAGYFAGEMPLSSDPLNGTWTIRVVNSSVNQETMTETHNSCYYAYNCAQETKFVLASKDFSVLEFVTPRLDVRIATNKTYITSIDKEMQFQVTVKYTTGEAVNGIFDIAAVNRLHGYKTTDTTLLRKSISTNNNGTVTVSVPLKGALNETLPHYYNEVTIQANFTESATGVMRSATPVVIPVLTGPYHAKFESDTDTFIPGYPYLLKASILDNHGRPPPPTGRKAHIISTSANVSAGVWEIVPLHSDAACLVQPFWGLNSYSFTGWSWQAAVFGRQRQNWGFGFGINAEGFGGGISNNNGRKKRDLGPFVQHSYSGCHYLPTILTADVAADGTLNISIPTSKSADVMNILVSYDFQTSQSKTVFAKQSVSGSFLDISPVSADLVAGAVAEFAIATSTRLNEPVHIVVFSSSNASFLWTDSLSTPGQRLLSTCRLRRRWAPLGALLRIMSERTGKSLAVSYHCELK
ncbi:uncharacterized protein LOC129590813 isoform X1 [Paramacrobiotus metropolitanus]|uniref:uncharacterized protein LOC129590813 isoform X1 n=1 Tax=Paramacrobiotus metropolitanus TaxID=2943436 RepID=UPI0024463F31|nr:uncharacterized protein LOC129590813 isoform X1 [Paramacrobiotus metropolitanus]